MTARLAYLAAWGGLVAATLALLILASVAAWNEDTRFIGVVTVWLIPVVAGWFTMLAWSDDPPPRGPR